MGNSAIERIERSRRSMYSLLHDVEFVDGESNCERNFLINTNKSTLAYEKIILITSSISCCECASTKRINSIKKCVGGWSIGQSRRSLFCRDKFNRVTN